jgi:hypothetical protein
VVEPTHTGSNLRFDICVAYLWLIILSMVDDVPSTMKRSLTDFVNLQIKLVQSFGCAYSDRVCVHVFIGVSARICICITINVCTM